MWPVHSPYHFVTFAQNKIKLVDRYIFNFSDELLFLTNKISLIFGFSSRTYIYQSLLIILIYLFLVFWALPLNIFSRNKPNDFLFFICNFLKARVKGRAILMPVQMAKYQFNIIFANDSNQFGSPSPCQTRPHDKAILLQPDLTPCSKGY